MRDRLNAYFLWYHPIYYTLLYTCTSRQRQTTAAAARCGVWTAIMSDRRQATDDRQHYGVGPRRPLILE